MKNPKPNCGAGCPLYGDTPEHSATSASCSSPGKEGATSHRQATDAPLYSGAHGREGATHSRAPLIQRLAAALPDPNTCDRLIVAGAIAVLAAVAALAIAGVA